MTGKPEKLEDSIKDKLTCKPCKEGDHDRCYRESKTLGKCACMLRGHKPEIMA